MVALFYVCACVGLDALDFVYVYRESGPPPETTAEAQGWNVIRTLTRTHNRDLSERITVRTTELLFTLSDLFNGAVNNQLWRRPILL